MCCQTRSENVYNANNRLIKAAGFFASARYFIVGRKHRTAQIVVVNSILMSVCLAGQTTRRIAPQFKFLADFRISPRWLRKH